MELWHESAGDGPPILLLHAGVCDARMWERQMSSLADRHHVIRADLRGFGRSPFPPEKFSFAGDVVELIERFEVGPVLLLGASMSGRVALEVAVARPDLVEALILANAALPGWPWSEPFRAFEAEEEAALERGDWRGRWRRTSGCGSTARAVTATKSIQGFGGSSRACSATVPHPAAAVGRGRRGAARPGSR